MCAWWFSLVSVCCVCAYVYDPDPVLAVFCTELMMELLYTKYICKGLKVETSFNNEAKLGHKHAHGHR